jgi:hypothetical protein
MVEDPPHPSERWVLVGTSASYSPDGTVAKICGVTQDITELIIAKGQENQIAPSLEAIRIF